MDRRQVGLALHAALAQRADDVVAVGPSAGTCTTNTNQPRTSPGRRAVLARQAEPLARQAGQRLAVPAAATRARAGEHVVEAVELREPERAGDVAQPVVEPEPVVVEPAHVRRAALVALGVDARLHAASASVTIPPSPVVSCLLA